MKNCLTALFGVGLLLLAASATSQSSIVRFPADKATIVNPDTHLALTFPSAPTLGKSGKIRIYDANDSKLVDTLDLSIPPGPTAGAGGPNAPYTPTPYEYVPGRFTNANTVPGTPSGAALPTSRDYQLTIIGGFTDGFHFYPVLIRGNVATIYPHNNLLEYNSTNASDGKPVDVSQRKPESKQLTMPKDADTVKNYGNPAYVLGWTPAMAPLILSHPEAITSATGQDVTFSVKVTAIPDATYQWLRNGTAIRGGSEATLKLAGVKGSDAARYSLRVTNASGVATSNTAVLTVK